MTAKTTSSRSTSACRKKTWAVLLAVALFAALPGQAADSTAPVSRAEYDALMQQMAQMQKQLAELKAAQATATATAASSTSGGGVSKKSFGALQDEVTDLHGITDIVNPGSSTFVLAGSASASFSALTNTDSNFGATFSPIFLWNLADNLFVESEVEFELTGTDTYVNLEYVDINYDVCDYLTVIAGKFLSPMNTFVDRFEPKWINKLPDTPLAVYDGILPESNLGFQLRGGVPIGPTKLKYAAYVSNAPRLIADDPAALGQLEFANYTSLSSDKAYGGRLGLEVIPGVEAGYGVQYSNVTSESGVGSPSSFLQSVDFEAKRDSPMLGGAFTLLSQYAWTKVGGATYDPTGSLGVGPVNFLNNRDGGYVQLSYRPKRFSDLFNRFEFIVRGDMANQPSGAPGAFDEKRLTFGLDYWVTSYTVLKAAYEIDRRTNGEPNQNGFIIQFATGL